MAGGGHSPSQEVQGSWSPKFRQFHINILEAMAVLLTLRRLRPKRGIHIRLVLDSYVVVCCINRKGSRSPHVNHVVLAILLLAKKKRWHLSASHLEGVRNVTADALSRNTAHETEWSLDLHSFRWIQQQVPGLQVDLFATRSNRKLPLYVSPNLVPLALGVDAMSVDWNQWDTIYLFPPFNLLSKVLDRLRSFQGMALVAPFWPNGRWFPLLTELGLKPLPLPRPILSQVVQTKTVSASSWITNALRLWIF